MTQPAAVHDSFTIVRTYPHAPARVFAAWATQDAKSAWFAAPHDRARTLRRDFDFRIGGAEHLSAVWNDGPNSVFDAVYHDIVANERIVYSYAMMLGETRISVSLATVTFAAAGGGTTMTFTEQAVYLNGYADAGSRERGTGWLLDNLGTALAGAG